MISLICTSSQVNRCNYSKTLRATQASSSFAPPYLTPSQPNLSNLDHCPQQKPAMYLPHCPPYLNVHTWLASVECKQVVSSQTTDHTIHILYTSSALLGRPVAPACTFSPAGTSYGHLSVRQTFSSPPSILALL